LARYSAQPATPLHPPPRRPWFLAHINVTKRFRHYQDPHARLSQADKWQRCVNPLKVMLVRKHKKRKMVLVSHTWKTKLFYCNNQNSNFHYLSHFMLEYLLKKHHHTT
jgi:cobalamin biosynthesis Co2+ chelatase CbiK